MCLTMKRILNSFLLASCFYAGAQNYTHSLSITSRQGGLEALPVSTELKNVSNTGFNDVRILDKNNNEVPYFQVNESFTYSSTRFKEYKLEDKHIDNKRYTVFTVLNPDKKPIQNIVLVIKNSDAFKMCDIEGSDDKQQWYAVSDHIYMYNLYDEGTVNAYRTLYFPRVNYKYIKIHISDLSTAPLNIIKAGYFEGAISAGKLNLVKPDLYNFITDKEKKVSVARVVFSNSTPVDKMIFKIKAPNFYKRRAHIFVSRSQSVKGGTRLYREEITSFELNSESYNSFEFHNFREKEFEIEIENDDNPPLEIETIDMLQLQTYLVADFKAGENYTLFAGNKKLKTPSYDIEYFRDKISQYLPTLEVGELQTIPVKPLPVVAPKEKQFWEQPWFMWVCIAIASFILFLFSVKVLRDLKNK